MKSLKNATIEELRTELDERMVRAIREREAKEEARAVQIMEVIKADVDLFVPEHEGVSCSDGNLMHGFQSMPPVCARCALMQVVAGAAWPRGYEMHVKIEKTEGAAREALETTGRFLRDWYDDKSHE